MTLEDARNLGVHDGEIVSIKFEEFKRQRYKLNDGY